MGMALPPFLNRREFCFFFAAIIIGFWLVLLPARTAEGAKSALAGVLGFERFSDLTSKPTRMESDRADAGDVREFLALLPWALGGGKEVGRSIFKISTHASPRRWYRGGVYNGAFLYPIMVR